MGSETTPLPPHVLIFPLPLLGHVNSMLKLAELLCLAGIDVTFILSESNHTRLLKHTDPESGFAIYPGNFQVQTIPDGLPGDHPRAGERVVRELMPAIRKVTAPQFKRMMVDKNCFASASRRPVNCVICDGVLSFVKDFTEDKGIPLIYFRTVSACHFWACFCMPELIEAGEIPIQGNGMDLLVESVPGMEGFLRRRDLPEFCRVNDVNDPTLHIIKSETQQTPRAQAFILNTFEDLERPILSHIRNHIPRLYSIGPSPPLLKSQLAEKSVKTSSLTGSFWQQDRSCIAWLDSQPPKSVLYVSFGSITFLTRKQLLEFWNGLVKSGQRFLWVMRPDLIAGKDGGNGKMPQELEEAIRARGYLVKWAPQEEVLNHPAVGGFLTHSGWNSTLESIVAGVPMICWPYFADQMINSRFVSEVWKIGLDMKDTCDRIIVEKMIRDLMEVRKEEFVKRAEGIAQVAKKAVWAGGSSYSNLESLIDYIKSIIM